MYDWANSAFSALIQTFIFAAYFAGAVAEDESTGTSQWGYAIGVAGLVVAVGGPFLGAAADQGGRRKPWLAAFTLLCIVATALMWFVQPSPSFVILALLLAAIGTVGAEFAAIFYNAMLPDLAPPHAIGRWSGWAWGLGYAGGLVCLVIALVAFILPGTRILPNPEASEHVRATFPLVAVWLAVFSLPIFLVTPDVRGTGKRLTDAALDGVMQLIDSIRHVRQYGHLVRFLIARMIYIDGLATVFAFGGIFAAAAFGMSTEKILLFGIALNLTAGLGAGAFAFLDDRIGGKRTIIVSLICLMVTAALLLAVGSGPWVRLFGELAWTLDLGAMTVEGWEAWFWVFGLLLGVFVGPVQAASRSYLARLAPPRLRNEAFGLYAFSGKATSFLGPVLVAFVTARTGSSRWGMSVVLVFFVVGLALVATVPRDRPGEIAGE